MADQKEVPPNDYGPRNSFAPNDGYQYFEEEMSMNYERRRSSLRRNSSLVTDADFKNQAYGMLRKRKNPKPNTSDKMLHKLYQVTKIYIPLSSILAVTDFILDWRNAVQLISSDKCSQKAFGSMMFSTVLVIPMVFAMIQKSPEEYDMWEMIFRGCFGVQQKDPFGDVEEDTAPIHVRIFASICYIIFSPFTHLVTQMSLHTNSAEKVEFYMEFDIRKAKVMKQLHLGCFTSYDGDELDRLKELQFRATHYVQYYIKYAKDRLRYCLIEDTLQFNIQFAMFLYTMFTAPQDHPSTFLYLQDSMILGMSVKPEVKLIWDAFMYAGGLITSVLMLWQGYFQIERYHEQLMHHENIGLLRVLALCMKTTIELFLPPLSLVILMIKMPIVDDAKSDVMLTDCKFSDWFSNMILFYIYFLVFFSYGINFLWSFILNYSNRGSSTIGPILGETTRMSIYTSVISVKYNRIADHQENVIEDKFSNTTSAYVWLCIANFVKFLPMLATVIMFVPDFYPQTKVTSYAVTNDLSYLSYLNMKLRYDSEYMTNQVSPPYLVKDANITLPAGTKDATANTVCNIDNRDCFVGFYDKLQTPDTVSGGITVFIEMEEIYTSVYNIPSNTAEGYRAKVANLILHDDAQEFVDLDTDRWYEVIVTHPVYDTGGSPITRETVPRLGATEFSRYMNKVVYTTTNVGGLQGKLILCVLLIFAAYCLTCVMSEPQIRSSKYIRTDNEWVKMMYPLLLPLLISYASVRIEFSAIENQLKSFCRLYPDSYTAKNSFTEFVGLGEVDCVNGLHFKAVRRCGYGTVCFYDSRRDVSRNNLADFGNANHLDRVKIYNNPIALAEEFLNPDNPSLKTLENVESGLTEIYKRISHEPKLINTICLVYEDIQNSQFGDIFYDTRDGTGGEIMLDECDKCQRVLAQMASENGKMQYFVSATYSSSQSAREEAEDMIDNANDNFWKTSTLFNSTESTQYIDRLKRHLDQELECYHFSASAAFENHHKSVYKRAVDSDGEIDMTSEGMKRLGEKAEITDDDYPLFKLFHEGCSTGFRRCVTDKCTPGKFIEHKTANYLIKKMAEDAEKSYLVISDDPSEAPVFVNWPEEITVNPQPGNELIPMITELPNFTMDTLTTKTPNFAADTDMDDKNNQPLFNPYYHYAFDVYGSSTLRDLQAIPFHKLGHALNEIHDNVGPWMIPYEPPNVGPAVTNSLPAFRLRNDEMKLIGRPFEVDIINMPRQLRLDTSSSLWHHYIHSILFPFSAPLPWWTPVKDPEMATIEEHTFAASDAFMGGAFTGEKLYRQVSPIISFLYDLEENFHEGAIKKNSYFNVPIWAKEEDYGDLTSTQFNDWKKLQPEYVTKQDASNPWTEGTAGVDVSLDSACWLNFNDKAMMFGLGPRKAGVDLMADQFNWHTVGHRNRKRFRIDEDYLIYGPGGEGLKRTALNPILMQYQFDSDMRNAIRGLTYNGQNASANYDDGMGWAIDEALKDGGIDPSQEFSINMTYYLFTNLMSHMWPKDYDYRYPLPYSYDFDAEANVDGDQVVDTPLTKPCTDGSYQFIDAAGNDIVGNKMWCIGGPIAFDPNSKPDETYGYTTDLRDVTLGRVYKPQAEFIREHTDFFPFMDLGDPFINQNFVDSHAPFGLLHKFWDTPSRLKIYSTKTPYTHYKKRFDNNILASPVWYKPFVDLNEHHGHNLAHVNTYAAHVNINGTVVEDLWDKFEATDYHSKIRAHVDPAGYTGSQIRQRMPEPEDNMIPLIGNDRTEFGLENWQRLYTRKNKVSLNPGWHFFGREWDFTNFQVEQKSYNSDPDFLDGNEYYSEILDMDYSLYNVLPNSPTFVRTSSITDREAECFMKQPMVNERNYQKPIAFSPGGDNRYCDPNLHYVISRPEFLQDMAEKTDTVTEFNPAATPYNENKTYTDFNYGDLHISKPCVVHDNKAYIFGQVRRLKPFYYFYCDKWINDMTSARINMASDGGKISTRPCSKRVMDPLNRFQPWDTNPQTAFANREVSSDATENALLKRPFILSDPEIVTPYSLVFTYNGTDFDSVKVLKNGISPRRGSCISSDHYGGDSGSVLCFGGIVKGRATNIAMGLIDGEWKTSNDKDAGFIAEMAMPVPLIDHTVMQIGKKMYVLGGKTLLPKFKSNTEQEILDRGHDFMQYGYRKDFPLPASRDDEFVGENTPFKSYHKLSGEQHYPPVFGKPADYGILGHSTAIKRTGDDFSDYEESYHVYAFTGIAADGGTGWQITKRPSKSRKWNIQSAFYKRNYAYIFTPGGTNGLVSRYNIYRQDINVDADHADNVWSDAGRRKRRSMDYVKQMQMGKHSANTGPFLNSEERKMLFVKNDDETYFPRDWMTIMSEYFADDYHSGQMCKMCDTPSRTISFQKLLDVDSPFRKEETPDKRIQRKNIAMVMEIKHSNLIKQISED